MLSIVHAQWKAECDVRGHDFMQGISGPPCCWRCQVVMPEPDTQDDETLRAITSGR